MHAILWCCETCDCYKDKYTKWIALWLLNTKNHYSAIVEQVSCADTRQSWLLSKSPAELCSIVGCSWRLLQSSTAVWAASEVYCSPEQRSHELQWLIVLIVKSLSILHALPGLQLLSERRENALAKSERALQFSRGAWEHLPVHGSAGESYRWVWEVWVWVPDWLTFCWCLYGIVEINIRRCSWKCECQYCQVEQRYQDY